MRLFITADIDVMTNSRRRNSTSIESLDRSLYFLFSDEHLTFTIPIHIHHSHIPKSKVALKKLVRRYFLEKYKKLTTEQS